MRIREVRISHYIFPQFPGPSSSPPPPGDTAGVMLVTLSVMSVNVKPSACHCREAGLWHLPGSLTHHMQHLQNILDASVLSFRFAACVSVLSACSRGELSRCLGICPHALAACDREPPLPMQPPGSGGCSEESGRKRQGDCESHQTGARQDRLCKCLCGGGKGRRPIPAVTSDLQPRPGRGNN